MSSVDKKRTLTPITQPAFSRFESPPGAEFIRRRKSDGHLFYNGASLLDAIE